MEKDLGTRIGWSTSRILQKENFVLAIQLRKYRIPSKGRSFIGLWCLIGLIQIIGYIQVWPHKDVCFVPLTNIYSTIFQYFGGKLVLFLLKDLDKFLINHFRGSRRSMKTSFDGVFYGVIWWYHFVILGCNGFRGNCMLNAKKSVCLSDSP